MLSVLCPTIFMAVERGTPARSRFRTAVRRKSCGMRSDKPAAVQAASQARRKDLIGRPARWNSHGMIVRVPFSTARVRVRWCSSTAARPGASRSCESAPAGNDLLKVIGRGWGPPEGLPTVCAVLVEQEGGEVVEPRLVGVGHVRALTDLRLPLLELLARHGARDGAGRSFQGLAAHPELHHPRSTHLELAGRPVAVALPEQGARASLSHGWRPRRGTAPPRSSPRGTV